MGTPEFAVPSLEALIAAGHEVAAVYTRPPKPRDRGQRESRTPVHEAALRHKIAVRTPATLKDDGAIAEFAAFAPDAAVVAAYGHILPKRYLSLPRLGCLNVHASLLPRWRGAAPIQHAILAGDEQSGVTIMKMDAGLDTGDILLMESIPLGRDVTAGELHDRLAELGARLIVRALAGLDGGSLAPIPQRGDGATYAPKISSADARLDWRRTARELERCVRAFAPAPGAWFEWTSGQGKTERIKVLSARAEAAATSARPGQVTDRGLAIACGTGVLRLTWLQRAGRTALDAEKFLRGFEIPPGTTLALPV